MTKRECINFIDRIIDEMPQNIMCLYFVQKTVHGHEKSFRSFQPAVSHELQKQILCMVLPKVKISVGNNRMVNYNAVGAADGEIEVLRTSEVADFSKFISSLKIQSVFREMSNLKTDKIDFYCIKIRFDGIEMCLFRQFSKLKKLRSGLLTRLLNDELVQMDGDFLGIDEDIDILVFEDEMVVLNHISLERIFNYRDAYKEKTEEAMGRISEKDVMVNFEQFADDCYRDVRIMKKFTNIMWRDRLPLFFENYKNAEDVVREINLDIEFDMDGKLVYRDKSQLYHIVNLMSDSYFRSLLANRLGVSKTEGDLREGEA